jgi:transposase
MPLSTDVVSGERADDGLDIPIIARIRTGLKTPGLLCVGDGKMRALETRASLARHHDWYVSPLPLTGATAEAMDAWISAGVTQGEAGEFAQIFRTNDRGHEVLAAEGYEFERCCGAKGSQEVWTERVVVVRSPMHANHQAAGLDKRLTHAETALAALTPPRGRGKRQITDEATLVEAIALVRKDHRVEGVLSVAWEKQVERHTQYVGRGRGSASRQKRVIKHTRSHLTRIARQEHHIADRRQRFGWKACVTNAGHTRLSVEDAVLCYRNAYRVERVFNRLKSRVHIAPLFVKLNDHIEGLTYLLTLGVRV